MQNADSDMHFVGFAGTSQAPPSVVPGKPRLLDRLHEALRSRYYAPEPGSRTNPISIGLHDA
jgi:hypothetical protein